MARGFVAGCCVLRLLSWPSLSEAEDSVRERSNALFEQAKRLESSGNTEEACQRFQESYDLLPRGGTALSLARCLEVAGHLVPSWRMAERALSLAQRDHRPDREKEATGIQSRVRIRLGWVVLTFAPQTTGTPTVAIDRVPLTEREVTAGIPVDPGWHEVTVSAAGAVPWSGRILARPGTSEIVPVPPLLPAERLQPVSSIPTPAQSLQPEGPTESLETRTAGVTTAVVWSLAAVGVIGLGVGTYFGVHALEKKFESDSARMADGSCPDACYGAWEDARGAARLADVTIVASLLAVGASALVMFISGPGEEAAPEPTSEAVDPLSSRLTIRW